MKSLQDKLNAQGRLFEPRKSERTVYRQPARINGKDTYRQPKKEN